MEEMLYDVQYPKPNVGNKLKVSLRGSLKKKDRLLKALLMVAVAAVLTSFVLEFWAGDIQHSQFFGDLAIGVAGSAVISYLVLLLPFLDQKRAQIDSISKCLRHCFRAYRGILRDASPDKLDNVYMADLRLIIAQGAEKSLKEAIELYTDADIHSDQIMEILVFYESNFLPAVIIFEKVCSELKQKYEKNVKPTANQIQAYLNWAVPKMQKCCNPEDLEDLLQIFPNVEKEEENVGVTTKVSITSFEDVKLLMEYDLLRSFPRQM